jgi:hypothetical protein
VRSLLSLSHHPFGSDQLGWGSSLKNSGQIWRGEDLQDDEILRKYTLVLNKTYKRFACTSVQCGFFLTENWEDHVQRCCSVKVTTGDRNHLQVLWTGVPRDVAEFPPPANGPPVSGLVLLKGHKCNMCDHHVAKLSSMATHYANVHKRTTPASTPAWIQRETARAQFFAVTPPAQALLLQQPNPNQGALQAFRELFNKERGQPAGGNIHDTPKVYVDMHLNTLPTGFSAARQQVLLEKAKDGEEPVVEMVASYWRKVHHDIANNGFLR